MLGKQWELSACVSVVTSGCVHCYTIMGIDCNIHGNEFVVRNCEGQSIVKASVFRFSELQIGRCTCVAVFSSLWEIVTDSRC
jgi:hypothetical protein